MTYRNQLTVIGVLLCNSRVRDWHLTMQHEQPAMPGAPLQKASSSIARSAGLGRSHIQNSSGCHHFALVSKQPTLCYRQYAGCRGAGVD